MGIIQIIPGASFPSTIPRIATIDGIESSGSLLLVDPSHSAAPWASGLPANSTTVPNLLRSTANAVVGSSTTDPTLQYAFVAGKGQVERTAKGGLHVIQKTTATASPDILAAILFPAAIANFMSTNFSHDYFISQWLRVTAPRQAGMTDPNSQPMVMQSGSAFGIHLRTTPRYSSAYRTGDFTAAAGNYRLNAMIDSIPATWGSAPMFKQNLFQAGNHMAAAAADYGKAGSFILYRAYVEDLTVSGRTYAQVDALDASLHAQAFGVGGRYYGDTYTAP